MDAICYWIRPAVFALVWVLIAALTVSELATVSPSLQSAAAGEAFTGASPGEQSLLVSGFGIAP